MQVEQGQLLTQVGIWVNLVRETLAEQDGLITVYIPQRLVAQQTMLDFPLPQRLAATLTPSAEPDISTPEGEPVPPWLHYEQSSMRFVLGKVPADALPLELELRYAGKRWTLRFTATEVSAGN